MAHESETVMGEPLNLTTQLEVALNWSQEEYHHVSTLTHVACREHYGFRQFVDVFLSVKPTTTMDFKILMSMWKVRTILKAGVLKSVRLLKS